MHHSGQVRGLVARQLADRCTPQPPYERWLAEPENTRTREDRPGRQGSTRCKSAKSFVLSQSDLLLRAFPKVIGVHKMRWNETQLNKTISLAANPSFAYPPVEEKGVASGPCGGGGGGGVSTRQALMASRSREDTKNQGCRRSSGYVFDKLAQE